ncbi:MAG: cold-shock protein [Rubrobacter sp.]
MAYHEGYRAYLDHGEREGWGMRLPPAVVRDPAWQRCWIGVESVTVKVRRDSLVVEAVSPGATARTEDTTESVTDRRVTRSEVGLLRWFDEERGYGFIVSPSGEDRFFDRSGLLCDPDELEPDLPLEFEVSRGDRGPVASEVRPLNLRSRE